MRSVYLLWADDNHIDRLINSGIDTLLIPDYNSPPAPLETPEMPSYQRTLEIIDRYRNLAKIIIIPAWFQSWFNLPSEQMFTNEAGGAWTRTPCPTSVEYFDSRFAHLHDLNNRGLIDGVLWDVENYAGPGIAGFFSEDDMPQCYCERCRQHTRNGADLYDVHKQLWRTNLTNFHIVGTTPYSNPWVLGLFPKDVIWFSQSTYEEVDRWKLIRTAAEWDTPPIAHAGAWLEKHSDDSVVEYAESLMSSDLPIDFSGNWYYTHSRLTTDDNPNIRCPGPYCGPMEDVFYDNLKELSGGGQVGCSHWDEIDGILQRCRADIAKVCGDCECDQPEPEDCYPEYHGKGDNPKYPNDRPTNGAKFDHDWYLSQNAGVATSECFKDKPYAHYIHFGKSEGRLPYPTQTKVRKFIHTGKPSLLFDGGDNGVVTVAGNGDVYMAEGDIFVGTAKYETAIFVCRFGSDPMKQSSWTFLRGTSGKCYGLLVFKGKLLALQSDKGSGFTGTQNCRIWDVMTGWRSNNTLQDIIDHKGVNWFFVNKGWGYEDSWQEDTVDIGYMRYVNSGDRDFKTPISIVRGDPLKLQTFFKVGDAAGLSGPVDNRATTCSITYLKDSSQYISYLGYWSQSILYQFSTQADNVLGPYTLVGEEKFSPPMERHRISDSPEGYSGVFTGNLFYMSGEYYEVDSGHRHKDDDTTWITKVIPK